jgi:hypothetical protein
VPHAVGFALIRVDDPDGLDSPIEVVGALLEKAAKVVGWRENFDAKREGLGGKWGFDGLGIGD